MSTRGAETVIKPIRTLLCCCCGTDTQGRQWHNRDTGYGIFDRCATKQKNGSYDAATMHSYYGVEGVHYLLPAIPPSVQQMLNTFLVPMGFEAMAADVLTETDPDKLRKYARVILRQLPEDKKMKVFTRFAMLKLV